VQTPEVHGLSDQLVMDNVNADMTVGMRVNVEETGPVLFCVGRDDANYYFQDESGKRNFYSNEQWRRQAVKTGKSFTGHY